MKQTKNNNRRSPTQSINIAVMLLTLIGLSGCYQTSWEAKTYPATGTVMINGKPAESLIVRLHSVEKDIDIRQSIPWAKVQSDGTFSLRTYMQGDGAPAGEYAVTLVWPMDPSLSDSQDRLQSLYAKVDDAPVHVTIKKTENELSPIVLENVKVLPLTK